MRRCVCTDCDDASLDSGMSRMSMSWEAIRISSANRRRVAGSWCRLGAGFVACVLFSTALCSASKREAAPEAKPVSAAVTRPVEGSNPNRRSVEPERLQRAEKMDFSLSPEPISNPDLLFSHFSNRKLLIFYFSAKCVHCQRAFPAVQSLARELESQGVSTVAVAIKNNSKEDVRRFIRDFSCEIPVFHDKTREFSTAYGTGSVPLILTVSEGGEYKKFVEFDGEKTPHILKAVFSH